MIGFGYGPFGELPFGDAAWGRAVRYASLPTITRTDDAAEGHPLRDYLSGPEAALEDIRAAIRGLPDGRDPDTCPAGEGPLSLVLGSAVTVLGAALQGGGDGSVLARGEFRSPTARFRPADVGAVVQVRSGVQVRSVRVAFVLGPSACLTEPPLAVDPGPVRWELRAPSGAYAGNTVVEVERGRVEAVRPGWVLTDGSLSWTVVARTRYPRREDPTVPPVLQAGEDGYASSGLFRSASLVLTVEDCGRSVLLHLPDGPRWFTVESVGGSSVRLADGGGPVSLPSGGPFAWEVGDRAWLVLQGSVVPSGVVERAGADGVVASGGASVTVTSVTAFFRAADVGKALTLVYPAPTGQITGVIAAVGSPTSASVRAEGSGSFPVGGGLGWRIRPRTRVDDAAVTVVSARPPSLLPALASDNGVPFDPRHAPWRQRAQIRHVRRWADARATPGGVEVSGRLEGCRVAPTALYRVSLSWWTSLPTSARMERSEWGAGRHGSVGAVTADGTATVFADPGALFTARDVGRVLRLDGSVTHGWRTISTVRSATAVELAEPTPPEAGLAWHVSRLYSLRAPLLPRFDDFDADLFEELIDGLPPQSTDLWSIDRWCWEDGTVESVPVSVTAVAPLPGDGYTVTVEGRADVVVGVGAWQLTDAAGAVFRLETVPVQVAPGPPPSFTFAVLTLTGPTLGAASLVYVCEPLRSEDYAMSAAVRVEIEYEGPFEVPSELDDLSSRVVAHVERGMAVHEEVIPAFVATASASFAMAATVEIP